MSTIALKKTSIKIKTITMGLAIVTAIVLPQIFHAVGVISGTGSLLGTAFLPMHLPVILAGLLGGPAVGLVAGALSPLVSFAISGMPAAALIPFMTLELAAYGLVGGLLSKVKIPVFVKLLITQVSGRVVRAIAVLISVYGLGSQSVQVASILDMFITALPGILLQLALIPLLMYRMEGLKKYYE